MEVEIDIVITKSELEKHFKVNGKDYYVDCYIEFKSSSAYCKKWSGQLGIEVHHTHGVSASKIAAFKSINLSLVEIEANKKLAYQISADQTTPEKERKYIDFLKSRLSDYIWVKLLSDASSIQYLKEQNTNLHQKIALERENSQEIQQDLLSDLEKNQHERLVMFNDKRNVEQRLATANRELDFLANLNIFQFVKFKFTKSEKQTFF